MRWWGALLVERLRGERYIEQHIIGVKEGADVGAEVLEHRN